MNAYYRRSALAGLASASCLLAYPAIGHGQEPVPGEVCNRYHTDPGSFQLSFGLISTTQRLMIPRKNGSRRAPSLIYRSLRRQGYQLSYALNEDQVPTTGQAILAKISTARVIVFASTDILERGGSCTAPDGTERQLPTNRSRYVHTYSVRRAAPA